jgi:hypothetical protein
MEMVNQTTFDQLQWVRGLVEQRPGQKAKDVGRDVPAMN